MENSHFRASGLAAGLWRARRQTTTLASPGSQSQASVLKV